MGRIRIFFEKEFQNRYEKSCRKPDKEIEASAGENLFDAFSRHGIMFPGNCGSKGRCNACTVYTEELGLLKSCATKMTSHDLTVHILKEKLSQVLLDYQKKEHMQTGKPTLHSNSKQSGDGGQEYYGIAMDLGTTTIGMTMIRCKTGQIGRSIGRMNPQIHVGADVISRIEAACNTVDAFSMMRQELCNTMEEMMIALCEEQRIVSEVIKELYVAGNTTMQHILLGHSLQGLQAYPFTPVTLAGESVAFSACKNDTVFQNLMIHTMPGISAFVGGDIVAGAYGLQLGKTDDYELLIDLGTNGELLLVNRTGGFATSTACGPAFESCLSAREMAGVTMLDGIAMAYKKGYLAKDGTLMTAFQKSGVPMKLLGYPTSMQTVTQEMVREVQLAKAAIRTGIELLAYEAKLPLEMIKKVYLAGGFGAHLTLASAFLLDMFPEEFEDTIEVVGNTSLYGTIQMLLQGQLPETYEIAGPIQSLDLSMTKNFQEFFIHRLNFR